MARGVVPGFLDLVGTAAHERPGGLVIMMLGRFDDSDVEIGLGGFQQRGHGEAGGTATDDNHYMVREGVIHGTTPGLCG